MKLLKTNLENLNNHSTNTQRILHNMFLRYALFIKVVVYLYCKVLFTEGEYARCSAAIMIGTFTLLHRRIPYW